MVADGTVPDAGGTPADAADADGDSEWTAAAETPCALASRLCDGATAGDVAGPGDAPLARLTIDESGFAVAGSVIFAAAFLADIRFDGGGASTRAVFGGGAGGAGSGAGSCRGGSGIGVTTGGGGGGAAAAASTGAAGCVATAATGEAVVPVPASRQTAIPSSTISGTHSIATLAGVMPRGPDAVRRWLSQPILASVGDGVSSERSAEIR